MEINKLIRENIRSLTPYSSAREEHFSEDGIFMDANENAFGSVLDASLNRYPDPSQRQLKNEIAKDRRISPNQIFLGSGSDEAIDLLIRAFCEPTRDRIMVCSPTYGMYSVCAAVNNVEVVEAPLTPSFQPNLENILNQGTGDLKLLFLCSPNNPTGNCLDGQKIKEILENFPGIVVLDEAYIDFAVTNSWLSDLSKYKNLVILQTFSKAWGLANIRLGMAFAHPEIIEILSKIKFPYNVNGVTLQTALEALPKKANMQKIVRQILTERERLKHNLLNFSFVEKIYPSDANFLLVKFNGSRKVYYFLTQNRILVRDRSNLTHCRNCLRITVGTPEQNQKLLDTLTHFSEAP